MIMTRGLPLGVDFAGGTIVIVKFDQHAGSAARPRRARRTCHGGGSDAVVQQYGDRPQNHDVMIRVRADAAQESGGNLSAEADAVVGAAEGRRMLGSFTCRRSAPRSSGPVVGEQLKRQGILATVLALAGILAYIALRFQFSFAVGAIVATLHDLLVSPGVPGVLPLRPDAERHRRRC